MNSKRKTNEKNPQTKTPRGKYQSTDAQAKTAAASQKSVIIEHPKRLSVALEITGTAPLIQNCFTQKALEQMLRKHMGLPVTREIKKPRECIEDATIRNVENAVCVPPTAIKKAMLSAASGDKTLKKTQLRLWLFVEGQSVPIKFSQMVPRMDMVRLPGMTRTPDVRFRPMFEGWNARLVIIFSEQLRVQTVVDLLNKAGAVGLGEWRPEKDGSFGTFVVSRHITKPSEIEEVRTACAVSLKPLVIPDWALDADIDPELLRKIADEGGEEAA